MTNNTMQQARAALAFHPHCGAHCRTTGQPCKTPSMPNGRCRMHGEKSPGAPRGERNGGYRHGQRTIEAREHRRAVRAEIRALRELMGSGITSSDATSSGTSKP